jgi:hypothetical protein
LLEHCEWLNPYLPVGENKNKKEFKSEVVGEAKTSLCGEGWIEPQDDFLDAHDEDLVLDDFPLDFDLTSRESCMRDDEDKVRKLTHELHMELSLAPSSSFHSSMGIKTTEDVSGTYGLMEELVVMVKHMEHSHFHRLDEIYGLGTSDYMHILHLGDHEPLILGSSLKTHVINVDGGVEHLPCGPNNMEVCAPNYYVNGYIEDVDTSIWDCGAIPSERLIDRDFEHITEFGLSRSEKLIDELHQVAYSLNIDLQLGYHHATFGCHYGHYNFLLMPLGFTNILATFQSCVNPIFTPQLQGFMLVLFDDLLI